MVEETTLVNMAQHGRSGVTRIDRATQFGNPFRLNKDGGSYTREESIDAYREWFHNQLEKPEFRSAVESLRGETLGCWCKPKGCHGDVIVDYLEESESSEEQSATVIVAGSRMIFDRFDPQLSDRDIRALVARALHVSPVDRANVGELVSGANQGSPDGWGETWASFRDDVTVSQFEPNWNDLDHPDALVKEGQYGKYDARAGFRRNEAMAEYAAEQSGPSALLVFWDGDSSGTENMITHAEDHGIPVQVIRLDRESERSVLLSGLI